MSVKCQECDGKGQITTIRKTLGGDRSITNSCPACRGTGFKFDTEEHRGLRIVKFAQREFEILEMQCSCSSFEQGRMYIDVEYKDYKEFLVEEELSVEEYSFAEYVSNCLENSY